MHQGLQRHPPLGRYSGKPGLMGCHELSGDTSPVRLIRVSHRRYSRRKLRVSKAGQVKFSHYLYKIEEQEQRILKIV